MNIEPISGESLFSPLPKKSVALEENFLPLDKSIIWDFSSFFWKNIRLWEKTYGEHFESSLPGGVSESHKPEVVKKSAEKFLSFLVRLNTKKVLPKEIIVVEYGPGTGKFASQFLDYLKRNSPDFYNRTSYYLIDSSEEALEEARQNLRPHIKLIKFYLEKSPGAYPKEIRNKVLYVRCGNFWSGLPCKVFYYKRGSLYEILTKAVLDKGLLDKTSLNLIKARKFDQVLTKNPKVWKQLIKSIKLSTKEKVASRGFIVNTHVFENLKTIIKLVNFNLDGYIEALDYIIPTSKDLFAKTRLPLKFDGAIGSSINGPYLKSALSAYGLSITFDKVRLFNMTATISKSSLKDHLENKEFVSIAEVALKESDNPDKETQKLFNLGLDFILFSDQAGGRSEFMTLEENVNNNIFKSLYSNKLIPVLVTRRKSINKIKDLAKKIKKQGIENLFVVSGDPKPNDPKGALTSIDILKLLSKGFYCGAVAHIDENKIANSFDKIRAGAKFLITQVSFDENKCKEWSEFAKRRGLFQKVPVIASVIPITSKNMLSILKNLPDIGFSKQVLDRFGKLRTDEQVKKEGLSLAKEMAAKYEESGLFSGIYIYTKSKESIRQLLSTV